MIGCDEPKNSWSASPLNPHEMTVAVLQGGISAEREVSLRSGSNVSEGLRQLGFTVAVLDAADLDFIEKLRELKPQLVFNALHGRYGEDGTIQGLLEILDIPYTGSGVLASALAMNKQVSKELFEQAGLSTPKGRLITLDDLGDNVQFATANLEEGKQTDVTDKLFAELTESLGTNHFAVKPNSEGSSVGVSLIDSPEQFPLALKTAMMGEGQAFHSALVEEYIPGRELTVSVLGDAKNAATALPVIEIKTKSGFYHFENKYVSGGSSFTCPADIDADTTRICQELALAAHDVLGCQGYSRSDIRLRDDGVVYLLETNTLPGLTSGSLIPKAAAAAGIELPELLMTIVSYALSK